MGSGVSIKEGVNSKEVLVEVFSLGLYVFICVYFYIYIYIYIYIDKIECVTIFLHIIQVVAGVVLKRPASGR